MNIFDERVDYTKYKDDIKDTEYVEGCHFGFDENLEVYDKKPFEIPRVKNVFRELKNTPKPEFYDLGVLEGLPMKGENVKVYHHMMNQFIATNALNSITNYLKFGACVIKFRSIPSWLNYDAFLDSLSDMLRKIGRKSVILKCEGENDCVLVQSKSFTDNIVSNVIERVRTFIFTAKNLSDYANVTVNLNELVSKVDPKEFREKVQGCVGRYSDTDKLVSRLETAKKDVFALAMSGDSVSTEDALCSAIILFARVLFNEDISDFTLTQCLSYLNQKLPKNKKIDLLIRTGKFIVYAIVCVDRMLDMIEDFQTWGNKAC